MSLCLFNAVYGCVAAPADNLLGLCAEHWDLLAPWAKQRAALPVPAHWAHGVSRWPAPLEPTWWSRDDVIAWERARNGGLKVITKTPDGWRAKRVFYPQTPRSHV